MEIWPISCKSSFPLDDDHVVVGPAPQPVGPDGGFTEPRMPMRLNVYPHPDCSKGLVHVRATGKHGKQTAQVKFHFT